MDILCEHMYMYLHVYRHFHNILLSVGELVLSSRNIQSADQHTSVNPPKKVTVMIHLKIKCLGNSKHIKHYVETYLLVKFWSITSDWSINFVKFCLFSFEYILTEMKHQIDNQYTSLQMASKFT